MPDVILFSILRDFFVNLIKMLHKTTTYHFFRKLLLGYIVYTFGERNHSIGETSSIQICILRYYLTKGLLFYDISSFWFLYPIVEKGL